MKNLIHALIQGADAKKITIICNCDYKDLRGFLDLKGYSDFKILDWEIKTTIILKD